MMNHPRKQDKRRTDLNDFERLALNHPSISRVEAYNPLLIDVVEDDTLTTSNKPSKAQTLACLALIDFGVLLLGLTAILGIETQFDLQLNLPLSTFLGCNLLLAIALGTVCNYMDLVDSRHCLGKAVAICLILSLINGLSLLLSGSSNSLSLCLSLPVTFGLLALISGWFHYELSRPFRLNVPHSVYRSLELALKRLVDLSSASLGLLLLSPVLAVTMLILYLECKSSPLFTQFRIGENEQPFRMYKLRSMIPNAEALSPVDPSNTGAEQLYKHQNDPRITRLGKLIRKLSVDELPQLWNVIQGEMSLVGPRPPLVQEYQQMNALHRRKFECCPGLTGLWQITGRVKNQRQFGAVARYDIQYLENWCLLEDLKILLKTIPVVILQRGAF